MRELITKDKSIGIFTIIITFITIAHQVSVILFFSDFLPQFTTSLPIKIIAYYFNFFGLSDSRYFRIFEFNIFPSGLIIYYINVLFCVIMLCGCILYYVSKFQEIFALQILFALIFFKNLVDLTFSSISIFTAQSFELIQLFIFFTHFAIKMVIVLFTYWIIKKMLSTQELISSQVGDFNFWIPATKFTRIMHVLLDLIFCYLIFGDIARQLLQNSFVQSIFSSLSKINTSLPLYLFIVIFRFGFYLVFEGIFGTTPAKMVTNTLVVNEEGKKAKFSNILKRTIIRFIPLESLSFITYGWHDSWSETNVLKLKPTKIGGLTYFIVFVTIAVGVYYSLFYFENNNH
jgi:hypothetical protein